jgi:hypothetical protein
MNLSVPSSKMFSKCSANAQQNQFFHGLTKREVIDLIGKEAHGVR